MTNRTRLVAAIGCAAALGGSGIAIAQDGPVPTRVAVTDAPALTAGQRAPFDAPGVRAIRRGRPIPRGYVLVGQTVDITRGTRGGNAKSAGAALTFRCPGTKRLRTFGVVGNAGFSAPTDYVRHRQTRVFSFAPPTLDHATGTLYAVCR
jgi:hypothetical protein